MAPLVRTGGSRHSGLAALPHRNIHKYINRGRTSYGISISSKNVCSNCELRFCILIGFNGQVDHASYRNILKRSYKFIVNADNLADFLKNL